MLSIRSGQINWSRSRKGIRPENGGFDPLSRALVFSASLAFIVLNILIIALAAMKVSIPEKDQK